MKLFLYSDTFHEGNKAIDKQLLSMLPANPKVTYIPSASDECEPYFEEINDYYSRYNIKDVSIFNVDKSFTKDKEKEVLESDMIFLSGGNTYYFLKYLRESSFLEKLKEFVEKGGVLVGVSAGSIIMTPNINLAGVPKDDCDVNEVGLEDLTSMGLVDFEFFPHYDRREITRHELLEYSKEIDYPLYVCQDGEGVMVDGEDVKLVGDVITFINGEPK